MKHGDKAIGIIHRSRLEEGHVRLTRDCRVNGRATGPTEVATDSVSGIRVAVFVERQISREFDISILKDREG